jgi:hypothetical protein
MQFDSNRTKDEFGYLTVTNCILTGEDVAYYYGYEVPNYQKHKLDPKKVYRVYRPREEIEDSDFSNKPLLSQHMDFSAKDYKEKFVVGTTGESRDEGSEKKATVVFWKQEAIDDLEKGTKKHLSCGYLYEPVIEKGVHSGVPYDIRMTKIRANHVAMVNDPRYKPATVADENSVKKETKMKFFWQKDKEVDGLLTLDEAFDAHKAILDNDKMSEDEKAEAIEKVKSKAKRVKGEVEDSKKVKDKKKVEDEDMEEDEPTMDRKSMDKKGMDKKDCMPTKDSNSVDVATLAERIAEEKIRKFKEETMAFDAALGEYERVCGKANRMAFDSAESVLDTILRNSNKEFKGKSFAQKQAMVEVLESTKSYVSPKITLDNSTVSKISIPSSIKAILEKRN